MGEVITKDDLVSCMMFRYDMPVSVPVPYAWHMSFLPGVTRTVPGVLEYPLEWCLGVCVCVIVHGQCVIFMSELPCFRWMAPWNQRDCVEDGHRQHDSCQGTLGEAVGVTQDGMGGRVGRVGSVAMSMDMWRKWSQKCGRSYRPTPLPARSA